MYAERLILETDIAGKIKQIPVLPANKQLEAIFFGDCGMQPSETTPPTPS